MLPMFPMLGEVHVFHFFFFNDTATTEIYTLSLHDALPISGAPVPDDPMNSTLPFGSVTSRPRSEEHTSELQSRENLVCRLLLEKKSINSHNAREAWITVFKRAPLFHGEVGPDVQRLLFYFFFNDTATTEIYTLSLHDALPI